MVWKTKRAGFVIALAQAGPDDFTVRYGKQTDAGLTYADAAAKLGQALMHALACEGKLDNRDAEEAKKEDALDARVENHGSIYLIRPLTEEGKDWLHGHTNDEAQWFGGALVVEPRYVENLVEGMRGDGLNL
jgi:hypothetical protein